MIILMQVQYCTFHLHLSPPYGGPAPFLPTGDYDDNYEDTFHDHHHDHGDIDINDKDFEYMESLCSRHDICQISYARTFSETLTIYPQDMCDLQHFQSLYLPIQHFY